MQENTVRSCVAGRQEWEDIFQAVGHPAVVLDPSQTILAANRAMVEVSGLPEDELVGRKCYEIFHALDSRREAFLCPVERIRESGRLETVETEMEAFGRTYVVVCTPVYDEAGRLEKIIHIATDITAHKRTEEALRESEERYRLLVEGIDLGVTLVDTAYNVLMINTAQAQWGDLPKEELIGQKCYQVFGRSDTRCADCPGTVAMATGLTGDTEMTATRRNGEEADVRVQDFPILGDDGTPKGFIEVVEDITARKRIERERRELELQVQRTQRLESLGVLAGGIAHDFNNLLAVIAGNAELSLDHIPELSAARECIEEIETASRQAKDLCRQMLAYSGRGMFVREVIDLRALVAEAASLLRATTSKKARIEYADSESRAVFEGDPSQINQVVLNLITNASEAIGEGIGAITVSTGEMECGQDYLRQTWLREDLPAGRYAFLEVADDGCGMDEETLARIFDPFFTTKFTGRGLGLAAVLGIVRGHKGALDIRTQPGEGTTFRVLFPATDKIPRVRTPECCAYQNWRGTGTVLLVDDEDGVRDMGRRLLEGLGFSVVTASDGEQAVEAFRQDPERFVCAVVDLTMPQMDGGECCQALRAIREDIPVVLVSGYSEEHASRHFADEAPSAFLQKPFTRKVLIEHLKPLVEG